MEKNKCGNRYSSHWLAVDCRAINEKLKCASELCGWFSSIRAILTASQRRSSRLRPRLAVGLIRFERGFGVLRRTAVDVMV